MRVPGQNILNMALSVISKQTFMYMAYMGRTTAANGTLVSSYAESVSVQGSFQPVPRRLFQNLSLDMQSNYAWFYVPQGILDVARNVSGDQFIFNGKRWQAESKTAWDMVDGWDAVLCVEVTGS